MEVLEPKAHLAQMDRPERQETMEALDLRAPLETLDPRDPAATARRPDWRLVIKSFRENFETSLVFLLKK